MTQTIYVIPLKNGLWRTVRMSPARHARWELCYRRWWATTGHRLAVLVEDAHRS